MGGEKRAIEEFYIGKVCVQILLWLLGEDALEGGQKRMQGVQSKARRCDPGGERGELGLSCLISW